MKLWIRFSDGDGLRQVKVSEDASVKQVMWLVEWIEGIPVDQQRIYFSQRCLKYQKLLKSYDIQHKSAIDLIIRTGTQKVKSMIKICMPYNDIPQLLTAEDLASDTIEKAFLIFEVDPKIYDLYLGNINICQTQWDFNTSTEEIPYRFLRKNWLDRRKALFTFKNYEIGLPAALKRELIFFI